MAFGTSAVFCFFRTFTLETGSPDTHNTHTHTSLLTWALITALSECVRIGRSYLGVFEQHGGEEAQTAVGDVQTAVVRHFLLQRTDVSCKTVLNTRDAAAIVSQTSQTHLRQQNMNKSLTVQQVFSLGEFWEEFVECFVVLHKTLRRPKEMRIRNVLFLSDLRWMKSCLTLLELRLSLLSKGLSTSRVRPANKTHFTYW